jgi:RNAse (barnase) inhibitor barstar
MKQLLIDGGQFDSQKSFYESILRVFPEAKEHFGYNLDALYDVLSEESYDTIVIRDFQKVRFDLSDEFYMSLLEILFDLDVKESIRFEVEDSSR